MKPAFASLSLDLDNQWSYLKTQGDPRWETHPSYLDLVVPRILDILEQQKIRLTVFVVGQDAALESNRSALASIASAGHEIGNHTFHHEPWLHLYTREQLLREFETSEQAILEATGQQTIGFRGPGFSISDEVLRLLHARHYEYDATIFPTFLGPLARAYCFFRSGLNRSEKQQRKALFGRFSDGWRPNKPFAWNMENAPLIEIPVTTMPVFKLPIHLSYLMFLARFSRHASQFYFWQSIEMCRWFGVEPSILLHPTDFLGREDDTGLDFFPAMDMARDDKLRIVRDVLKTLQSKFSLVCLREHAAVARERNPGRHCPTMVRATV